MPYREKRIYSGALLEIERVHCTRHGRILFRRGSQNQTGDAQRKINLKNSRRELMRTMCANFTKGDYHLVFTLDRILPKEELAREWEKLLRKLRRACRKAGGGDLRYIWVREDRGVRPHFHLVCGAFPVSVQELQELWGRGRVDIGTLDANPDYGWFARYLSKQKEQDKGARRWHPSKNLKKPVRTKPKVLKRKALASRPQVPKDYHVLGAYRGATGWGYEWEYIVAIRHDRIQKLPDEMQEQIQGSRTWGEFCEPGEG